MSQLRSIVAGATALLLAGAAPPVGAVDLGGTVGGSDTSIATATYDSGSPAGETGSVDINRQDGSLATVDRSPGSTTGAVNLGRPGDTIGTASAGTGGPADQNATLGVFRSDGSLASVSNDGNSTNGAVNVGGSGIGNGGGVGGVIGALPPIPGIGGNGGGGIGGVGGTGGLGGAGGTGGAAGGGGGGGGGAAGGFAALSPAAQQQVVNRCVDVLARPALYEQDLGTLCRLLATARR